MKKTIATLTAVTFTTMMTACATPPDKVSASYVSPIQYSDYSCTQIKREMTRVQRQVNTVTGQQQKAATNDAVATGVALVLFWPAIFFIAGGDKADELAALKGEYEALQQAAIKEDCDL